MNRILAAIKVNGKMDDDNGCPWFDADCENCPYEPEHDKHGRACVEAAMRDVNELLFEQLEKNA